MATSGTTAFDLNIDDIIEEAYEQMRNQRTNSLVYDIKSARRSLNIIIFRVG